jgi:lipopolysaccharide/colanic/teichoic acid biosynthesis glycosyltransferase
MSSVTAAPASEPALYDSPWDDFAPPARGWYAPVRATVEFVGALALLVVTAPVIIAAALLVKLTSRGPAFYTQTRLGQGGRTFQILKLRTMYQNSERDSGPQWCAKGDPRVTPVGRFLRRTHLDELPQLWNILRGDMSLIGPRPERPEFLPKLERAIPRYRQRLRVRPGVTGFAQVQLPPDSDLVDVRRKQAYDVYYIAAMSPLLDLRILLSTPLKVCGVPYAVLGRLFAMPSEADVESFYQGGDSLPELAMQPLTEPQPA